MNFGDDRMRFFRDGIVTAPMKAYAIWFMAQYVRFGHLTALPDAKALADQIVLSDLYAEVASDDEGHRARGHEAVRGHARQGDVRPAKPEEEAKRP